MKKDMCKGCWALCQKVQLGFWNDDGTMKLDKPTITMKLYCNHHNLHLDYMDRVVGGDKKCLNYYNNTMD